MKPRQERRTREKSLALILVVSFLVILQSSSNLPFPTVGASGIVRVQGNARGTSTSSPISVTMGAVPRQGDTLIAVAVTRSYTAYSTVSSITQAGVSWIHVTTSQGVGYLDVDIWMGAVGSGASSSVSVAVGSSVAAGVADICEYSGLAGVDRAATKSGSGSTASTGTTTATTQPNELWVGGIVSMSGNKQTSPTNGFTLLDGAAYDYVMNGGYLEKVVSSTGTASSGVNTHAKSNAPYWAGAIATFEADTPTVTTTTSSSSTSSTSTSTTSTTLTTSTTTRTSTSTLTTTSTSATSTLTSSTTTATSSSTTVTIPSSTTTSSVTTSSTTTSTPSTSTSTTTTTSATTSTTATTSSTTTTQTSSTTTNSQETCTYQILMSGSTVEAQNCATRAIAYSGSDPGTVISDAISALSGGGSIYIEAGTYVLSNSITNYHSNNIEMYGQDNSTILQAGTNFNNDVIYFDNVNGAYIHDLEVNGNAANQNGAGEGGGYNGIELYNSNNDVISHCYVYNDKTYGIMVFGTGDHITNNEVQNSDANGIIVYGGSTYLIQNNIVDGASDVGISISGQSSTQTITNVLCTGNTILNINMGVSPYNVNSGDGIITGDNGIAGGNITVSNNYIDVAHTGMWISQTQGVTVSGNTIVMTASGEWAGMAVGEADDEPTENAIIQSNTITAPIGIYIYTAATNTVQFLNNILTSSSIRIEPNSAPVIIEGNTGYNPVGLISSPISGSMILDSGSSSTWTSGTTYANWESPKLIDISGGTVTAIVVDGKALPTSTTSITLQPGSTFSATFSSAPTIKVYGE